MEEKEENLWTKRNVRDLNSKSVFGDPILCSQFLRDYVDIPLLKNVQPEDIEDVTERFRTYLGVEFEADTVKRIKLNDCSPDCGEQDEESLYLISLIEHKSQVDYNVAMQLLRYMVCIWNDYEKDMKAQKRDKKTKAFRYPPILPIVYYEGAESWTADMNLKDRIFMHEIFDNYIPDFTYKLIENRCYSDEELLSKKDEMSLVMLINKMQEAGDISNFLNLPQEQLNRIVQKAPEHILQIIVSIIWSLCMKLNVPETDIVQCIEKVKERRMGYFFENFEKFDIQELWRERDKVKSELSEAKEELTETREELTETKEELTETKEELTETREKLAKSVINLCCEFGLSGEEILVRLQTECGMTEDEADAVLNQHWSE